MFRNQYDNDVTIWSPQGRLHQVEYAMEAVKQGSATVGLKSKTHVVLVALKRANDLSAHQKKMIPIDKHIVISIAGLTADARSLSKFMRIECGNNQITKNAPMEVGRLMTLMGNKMQVPTQRYDKRPYGVGLLIAGYSEQGPHLYQACPSANFYECKAMAIGNRSQSARTYLEKHLDEFADCDIQTLVEHALKALRDTLPNEVELNNKNCSVAVVGKDTDVSINDNEDVDKYLAGLDSEDRRGGRRGDEPPPPAPTEAPPTDDPPAEGGDMDTE